VYDTLTYKSFADHICLSVITDSGCYVLPLCPTRSVEGEGLQYHLRHQSLRLPLLDGTNGTQEVHEMVCITFLTSSVLEPWESHPPFPPTRPNAAASAPIPLIPTPAPNPK